MLENEKRPFVANSLLAQLVQMEILEMCSAKRHLGTIVTFMLITLSPVAFSQMENSIKAQYDNDNLPSDELFLPKFLEHITGAALQQPTRDEQISYIGTNLLLKDTVSAEAEEYLNLFIDVRDETRNGKADFIRNNVCPLNSTRPTGTEFLDRLDAIDERSDELGATGLSTVRLSMTPVAFNSFLGWMDKVKTSSKILRFDHKIAYANRNIEELAQRYCARFDNNNTVR